jgi:hypothetical protein
MDLYNLSISRDVNFKKIDDSSPFYNLLDKKYLQRLEYRSGYEIVDKVITNFHLPESTLLMLVSAFAGRDFIFKAYKKAISIHDKNNIFNHNSLTFEKYCEINHSINKNILPYTKESLTKIDKFNEAIMCGLRTNWGVSLIKINSDFGSNYKNQLIKNAQKHINKNFLFIKNDFLYISRKGKFLSDGIASDLFILN